MSLPDLEALLRELAAADVDYVAIGGVAVGLHGFLRTTEDLDIVPAPDPANLDRLGELLERLGATLTLNPERAVGARERWELHRGRNLSVRTAHGDLDIVRRLDGVPGYEELAADKVDYDVGGMTVPTAGREQLIAMKQAGGREIDLADIAALRDLPT